MKLHIIFHTTQHSYVPNSIIAPCIALLLPASNLMYRLCVDFEHERKREEIELNRDLLTIVYSEMMLSRVFANVKEAT